MKGSILCRWFILLALVAPAVATERPVSGQDLGDLDAEDAEATGRFKVLTGPDALDNLDKIKKDRGRPPLEIFRAQFAPFDILPFAKARHWSTINLEARSNYNVYEGLLQSAVVPMRGMSQTPGSVAHEVIYRRSARLPAGQQARLGFQALLPVIPRELPLELTLPDAIRPDEIHLATIRPLEAHQMLVVVLAGNPNEYGTWSKLPATLPASGDRDASMMDRQRYYRMVIPQDAGTPLVSPHPLTWTTISHALWDGMDPDTLTPAQQEAMLDWLHWGGQLVIVGGASPSLGMLRESFLGPYLPADPGGKNALLDEAGLRPLSEAYRPSTRDEGMTEEETTPRYGPAVPIRPAPGRPVFFAGLRPREGEGVVSLRLGDADEAPLLGVERRVGRGRITMLSFSLTDPALVGWPGYDTLVRRIVFRRPEERLTQRANREDFQRNRFGMFGPGSRPRDWRFACLAGPELSWVRYLARDLGATPAPSSPQIDAYDDRLPREPVADWDDRSALPALGRSALKTASGITIPSSQFILKVILAYIAALVPLNWLICRYLLGRREWAWVVVPILSLGFAVGVERAASYDLGFEIASDEVDLLELHADYPKAHLSRFASIYSTGRFGFTISYPDDPTALALPMATGDELRGEEAARSTWQTQPVPALVGLQVQPRSIRLFRAEQIVALPGAITLQETPGGGPRRIVNGSGLELRDAELIDVGQGRRTALGTIAPGATVPLGGRPGIIRPIDEPDDEERWLDPEPFQKLLREYDEGRPEGRDELRLVAWTPGFRPGQELAPAVDRRRGLTLVVAHLRFGPPPDPGGPTFDVAAESPPTVAASGPGLDEGLMPTTRETARP